MSGYPSGMYGSDRRNWNRIGLSVGAALLSLIVIYGGYRLIHGIWSGESKADALSNVDPRGSGVSDANSQVVGLINEAVAYMNGNPGKVIESRDRLNEILPMTMGSGQRQFIKEQLSKLSDEWLFSKKNFSGDKLCGTYKVARGDTFSKISSYQKVPYEILMSINGISDGKQLREGDTLKVINGPFHSRVYRSTFTMDLYLQNTFVRSFRVGLGKTGKATPTGLWVVKSDGRMISPTWTDPDTGKTYEASDADYPLGSRWIALKGIEGEAVGRTGFAIHGSKDPNQIGLAESRGCIRMHNGDAVLIYNLLMPGISQVQVMD